MARRAIGAANEQHARVLPRHELGEKVAVPFENATAKVMQTFDDVVHKYPAPGWARKLFSVLRRRHMTGELSEEIGGSGTARL